VDGLLKVFAFRPELHCRNGRYAILLVVQRTARERSSSRCEITERRGHHVSIIKEKISKDDRNVDRMARKIIYSWWF
jgi:hypothetical protein